MADDEFELSFDEAKAILTRMLESSPPGELLEVIEDLRTLLKNNDRALLAVLPKVCRKWVLEQMPAVQIDGKWSLITEDGEKIVGEYVDPENARVVLYDHLAQKVTGTRPLPADQALSAQLEEYRHQLHTLLNAYITEHYENGHAVVYASPVGAQLQLVCCVTCGKFSPDNFWNGRWTSRWTCTVSPTSGAPVELSGKIAVWAHYFENGNVQMRCSAQKKVSTIMEENAQQSALAIVEAIQGSENAQHDALGATYMTMGDTTFKALRRALPITCTKIDWANMNQYKITDLRNTTAATNA